MATIAENLQTIKDSTEAIKQAIIDKGVTISGGLTTYADAIQSLPSASVKEELPNNIVAKNPTAQDYANNAKIYNYLKNFCIDGVLVDSISYMYLRVSNGYISICNPSGDSYTLLPDGTLFRVGGGAGWLDVWEENKSGVKYEREEGYITLYDDNLWKARQTHVAQEVFPPSLDTASLYEVIVKNHEGTKDDPIPFTTPMEIFKDKYYTQDGVLYLCIRDSGIALTHNLRDLVGIYVHIAS